MELPVELRPVTIVAAQNYLNPVGGEDQSPCSADRITLNAEPSPGGTTGFWTIIEGEGMVMELNNASSILSGLLPGSTTTLTWTLNDGFCPQKSDTIIIDNIDGADINANFL